MMRKKVYLSKAMGDVLTTGQVAKCCQVVPQTVVRWVDLDMLKGDKLPSGHRRIKRTEFIEFAGRHNMGSAIAYLEAHSSVNGK